jgi:formyl-CoA transferase
VPPQAGNDHPTGIPTGAFKTQDSYVNIAASGQHMWRRLCEAVDAMELCEDPRFVSPGRRSKNRHELNPLLEQKLQAKTTTAWVETLNAAGVPSGPILSIDQVFANEQVQHLGLARPIQHPQLGQIEILGHPVTLSRTPGGVRTPTAEKGEHSEEILQELGMSLEEIEQLRGEKVI